MSQFLKNDINQYTQERMYFFMLCYQMQRLLSIVFYFLRLSVHMSSSLTVARYIALTRNSVAYFIVIDTNTASLNLEPGALVLLCDSKTPRGCWPKALVEERFPDKSDFVRRVRVRTANAVLMRDVVHLKGICDVF